MESFQNKIILAFTLGNESEKCTKVSKKFENLYQKNRLNACSLIKSSSDRPKKTLHIKIY